MNWSKFLWQDVFRRAGKSKPSRVDFLRSSPFFIHFSSAQMQLTNEFLHQRSYESGEYIFELGHPGAALYFIESGQISIEVNGEDGLPVQLAVLEPGSFFGEMALLDDAPRSANARAQGKVSVLALPRAELDRMVKRSPEVGGLVYRALAEITSARLKATIERIQKENEARKSSIKMVANG